MEWSTKNPLLNLVGGEDTIEEVIKELQGNAQTLLEHFEKEKIKIPQPDYLNKSNKKTKFKTISYCFFHIYNYLKIIEINHHISVINYKE